MDKLDELIMKAAETYVDPDVELFEVMEQDATGAILTPGFPERCQGNGEHPNFEICCDNCDHFLTCFPEYQGDVDEAFEELRNRKGKSLSESLVGVLSSNIDDKRAREERLEDERDLEAYNEAMAEHRKNPVTYTFDEVLEELGISHEELDSVSDEDLE